MSQNFGYVDSGYTVLSSPHEIDDGLLVVADSTSFGDFDLPLKITAVRARDQRKVVFAVSGKDEAGNLVIDSVLQYDDISLSVGDRIQLRLLSSDLNELWDAVGTGGTPSFDDVAKNLVFAGPPSGSNAAPSFRSLIPADYVQPILLVGYADEVNFDVSIYSWQSLTLTGSPTLSVSNAILGQQFAVELIQDETGNHTVTWWDNIEWAGGEPVIKPGGDSFTVVTFKTTTFGYYGFSVTSDSAGTPGPQGEPGQDGQDGAQGDPGPGVATGGTTGQYLNKASNTNYDTQWSTFTASSIGLGSVENTALSTWAGSSNLNTLGTLASVSITGGSIDGVEIGASQIVVAQGYRPINPQTDTTYTLILDDGGKTITFDNSGAVTLTVPLNMTVGYNIGTEVDLINLNSGVVTVTPDTDVTINSVGGKVDIAQYSAATLKLLSSDNWILIGGLS